MDNFNIWLVRAHHKTERNQRNGQWMFNTLVEANPELATRIRGTKLDPFYDDKRIDEFLNFVGQNWGD